MSGSSSARERARRKRSTRRVAVLLAALLVTAGVVLAGLQATAPDRPAATKPSSTPAPTPTPLASVNLSGLPIERAPFCDRLDEGDVEDALGAPVSATRHYGSGDRVALAYGVTDVSHEYDCTFNAADGTEARAWVFAEPVTTAVARKIVRESRSEQDCSPVDRGPTYGTPSVNTLCRVTRPAVGRVVTLRGLFGDAWLSCRLTTPGPAGATETVRRAEQWCVRVATTLGARP